MTEEKKSKPPGYVFGRPTEYKSEYCEKLIEHMSQGFSFETFGAIVNCHKDTLYQWLKKHEDFADAKKQGVTVCQLFWERIGNNSAQGLIENFSAASYIFNMKNRFKWTDRVEVTGDEAKPIQLKYNA